MKNSLLFCIVLFTITLPIKAQEDSLVKVTRFFYEVKTMKDKTNPDNISKGVAVLDISENGSLFADTNHIKRAKERKDSNKDQYTLDQKMQRTMEIMASSRPVFSWFIVKQDSLSTIYHRLQGQDYAYNVDQNELLWDINPSVINWNDYQVQQATTTYGGRNWTVLFTKEIPVTSGPYLFNNLPGLVVMAYDSENHYSFELLSSETTQVNLQQLIPSKNLQLINYKQNQKLKKNYYNKSALDLLIEINPENAKNAHTYPNAMKQKLIQSSNPIDRDF